MVLSALLFGCGLQEELQSGRYETDDVYFASNDYLKPIPTTTDNSTVEESYTPPEATPNSGRTQGFPANQEYQYWDSSYTTRIRNFHNPMVPTYDQYNYYDPLASPYGYSGNGWGTPYGNNCFGNPGWNNSFSISSGWGYPYYGSSNSWSWRYGNQIEPWPYNPFFGPTFGYNNWYGNPYYGVNYQAFNTRPYYAGGYNMPTDNGTASNRGRSGGSSSGASSAQAIRPRNYSRNTRSGIASPDASSGKRANSNGATGTNPRGGIIRNSTLNSGERLSRPMFSGRSEERTTSSRPEVKSNVQRPKQNLRSSSQRNYTRSTTRPSARSQTRNRTQNQTSTNSEGSAVKNYSKPQRNVNRNNSSRPTRPARSQPSRTTTEPFQSIQRSPSNNSRSSSPRSGGSSRSSSSRGRR